MADPRQITELPVATTADDEDIALIRQGTYDKQATLQKLRAPLLRAANNLSDLTNAATARDNLGISKQAFVYVDAGAADAYSVSGTGMTAYADKANVWVRISNDNTGACTLQAEALGAKAVVMPNGSDPAAGALVEEGTYLFVYDADGDGGAGAWVIQTVPAAGVPYDKTASGLTANDVQEAVDELAGRGLKITTLVYDTPGGHTLTQGVDTPADVFTVRVRLWGGGGGAGASDSGHGGGGSGGGYAEKTITLAADESVTITVGAGGPAGVTDAAGTAGESSIFGSYFYATGGGKGYKHGTGAQASDPAGTGVSGDINLTGQQGQGSGSAQTESGDGGDAPMGGLGGHGSYSLAPTPGTQPGGGGASSWWALGASDGGDGLVLVSFVEPAD